MLMFMMLCSSFSYSNTRGVTQMTTTTNPLSPQPSWARVFPLPLNNLRVNASIGQSWERHGLLALCGGHRSTTNSLKSRQTHGHPASVPRGRDLCAIARCDWLLGPNDSIPLRSCARLTLQEKSVSTTRKWRPPVICGCYESRQHSTSSVQPSRRPKKLSSLASWPLWSLNIESSFPRAEN
jgi:hypothetical protein